MFLSDERIEVEMLESPLFYLAIGLGAASILALFLYAGHALKKRAMTRTHELLQKGLTSTEIEPQLISEGFDPETAARALERVVKRLLLAHPTAMLEAGHSQQVILNEMIGRGIAESDAERVIAEAALLYWGRRWRFLLIPGGLVMSAAGVGVIFVGLILRDGNLSGKLVTFPFAGGITMLAGVGILCLGVTMVAVVFAKTF